MNHLVFTLVKLAVVKMFRKEPKNEQRIIYNQKDERKDDGNDFSEYLSDEQPFLSKEAKKPE